MQILKVRLQSLESQFSSLERRLREVKHRPRPSLSRVFAEPERCLGGGYAKLNVQPEQLSSIGLHGLMFDAASGMKVVLRRVLKERSHCVPYDLIVREETWYD